METAHAAATPSSQREPVGWRGARRRAILVAVALALLLTAPACTTEPEPAALLDEALVGRSLASLVRDLPVEGSFELRPADRQETTNLSRMRGEFWRTSSGNAYLRVKPFDRRLVARLAAEVVGRSDEARSKAKTEEDQEGLKLLLLHKDFYRGDEYQLTVGDLVISTGALRAGSGSGIPEVLDADCRKAVQAHNAAVRRYADDLKPAFVREGVSEVWRLDLEAAAAATGQTARAAGNKCADTSGDDRDSGEDPPHLRAIQFERTHDTVTVRTASDGSATERDVLLTLMVRPANAGTPPVKPRPTNAFRKDNQFLLRINECGALPWEYVDFAAADSWVPPHSERYVGPTLLGDRYACEAEVSPEDKEDAADDMS